MIIRVAVLVLTLVIATVGAEAHSIFDGNWVADLDTQSGLPTDVYLVSDGQYSCSSCEPPRAYPADGKLRLVRGDPDNTSEAVRIVGTREIVTHIVGSALDRTTTMTVAPDNRTATYISVDHRPGIAATLRTQYLARRTAPAPAGAHLVSGTWQGVRYVAVPAQLRTITLRLEDGKLSYSTPLGTSFTATLGGGFVPVHSAHNADTQVAVRQSGPRQIEERVKQDGREIILRILAVSPDGRSMKISSTDLSLKTTFSATSRLQR